MVRRWETRLVCGGSPIRAVVCGGGSVGGIDALRVGGICGWRVAGRGVMDGSVHY